MSTLDTHTASTPAALVRAAQPPGGAPPPSRAARPARSVEPLAGRTTLALSGELDLACAGRLDRLLRRLDRSPGTVDVDLGAVTFADSHGVQPLLDAVQRRRAGGSPALRLVDVSPEVTWVLDLLGSPLDDQASPGPLGPPGPRSST